jgi:hypothetical protein
MARPNRCHSAAAEARCAFRACGFWANALPRRGRRSAAATQPPAAPPGPGSWRLRAAFATQRPRGRKLLLCIVSLAIEILLSPWHRTAPARAADEVVLDLPLACTLGDTCRVQQYVDHDPWLAARDYQSGTPSLAFLIMEQMVSCAWRAARCWRPRRGLVLRVCNDMEAAAARAAPAGAPTTASSPPARLDDAGLPHRPLRGEECFRHLHF